MNSDKMMTLSVNGSVRPLPFRCPEKNAAMQSYEVQTFTANEIVHGLYLGNAMDGSFKGGLDGARITHIVSLCGEANVPTYDGIDYCRIVIADRASSDITTALIRAIRYIIRAMEGGGRVLVHCAEGISRAPTIVTGYLMVHLKMTFDDALGHVQARRPTC